MEELLKEQQFEQIEKIMNFAWKDPYQISIAEYIFSWKFHDKGNQEQEIYWLKKSINTCSDFVHPYERLANIYAKKEQFDAAKKCYCHALSNVRSTEYFFDDAISAQAFIDEYITGVCMSDINYEFLKKEIRLLEKNNQYTISQIYFLDEENSVMVHLNEKEWNYRNKICIEIICKNKNWKFRYLGFGNIEGELVVKLFLLNGNLEELKKCYSEKEVFFMLVYEN